MAILDPQNPKRNIKLVGFIFGVPAAITYFFVVWMGIANLIVAQESTHWPTAEGRVTTALDSKQMYASNNTARIWYEYTIAGRLCRSDRVNFFERGALEKYRQGDRVLVHYKPSDPADACLVPGISFAGALNVALTCLVLPACGACLVKLFLSWLRNDETDSAATGLAWLFAALLR